MEDKKLAQRDAFRELKERIDSLLERVKKAEKEAIQSFQCSVCDVQLHDLENIRKHLDGHNHIKCVDRKKDAIARELTGRTYKELKSRYPELLHEEEFHVSLESDVKEEVKKERYFDDSYERKPAKFDEQQYERRMRNKNDDFVYCQPCGKSFARDHLINHENGLMHQKMTRPVERFECELCSISVTCQDSLNKHRKGKDHLKRAQTWEEQHGRKYEPGDPDGDRAYENLSRRDKTQVEELKKEKEVLQMKVSELYEVKKRCQQEHNPRLLKDLRDEVAQLKRENANLKTQLKGRKRSAEDDKPDESETKFKPNASNRGEYRERFNENERYGSYGDFKMDIKNSTTTRSRDRSRTPEPEVIDVE